MKALKYSLNNSSSVFIVQLQISVVKYLQKSQFCHKHAVAHDDLTLQNHK